MDEFCKKILLQIFKFHPIKNGLGEFLKKSLQFPNESLKKKIVVEIKKKKRNVGEKPGGIFGRTLNEFLENGMEKTLDALVKLLLSIKISIESLKDFPIIF